jgi:hypothetical protein
MSKLPLAVVLIFPLQLLSQKLYIYPTQVTAPLGSYQTVTAIVTGTNDKTVTWSASGGKLVGSNPCVVNEPCTVALYSTSAGTYQLSATSDANHSVKGSSSITFTASPTPVTSHPRLLITAAMLPGLRAKATGRNVMYQSIKTRAERALLKDNTVWSWSCKGGSGQPSMDESGGSKEQDANLFALMSLINPSESERTKWGCYGRDVWTYVMDKIISGKEVVRGNHWSDDSPNLALTTDWLMGSNSLSASDQVQARQFLAYMGKALLGYYPASPPVKGYNSAALFNTGSTSDLVNMRELGSNYTQSKTLMLTAIGLTFNDDTTDDPELTNSCSATRYQMCPDHTAGSLHAYWTYFDGSMLYMDWAHLEDPNVSRQAYQATYHNLPTEPACTYMDGSQHPCFGDSRDGASSEGSWYQYSLYRLRYALNIMHTAGYDDPVKYGPQVSLGTSSWWDLRYVNDIESLTGFSLKNGPYWGGNAYSSAYSFLTTGDTYTYWRVPNNFITEAAMMSADSYVGRTDRKSALEWIILNTAYGGLNGKQDGCTSYCGFDVDLGNVAGNGVAMDLMISLPEADPVAKPPSDPRPLLPTDLYDASNLQQVILRDHWGSNSTLFSHYCPNTLIDHEQEFCGRFDIYSKGEFITKGRVELNDYNQVMSAAPQSNAASYTNSTGKGCATPKCLSYNSVIYGGQFWHGTQQGFNTSLHSELPSYAAISDDDTGAYNGWWVYSTPHSIASYNDVRAASRDMVYLRNANQVVFYDRGKTGTPAAKAIYQITTGEPSVAGNGGFWLTRSGKQKAYFTSLLPAHATVANSPLVPGGPQQKIDWEPASSIKVSAADSTAEQFLSILEWGEATLAKTPTSLVESVEGETFDGAKVGDALVMFMRDWPGRFTGVTYPASGATTQYVSNLSPNTTYTVKGDGAPTSAASDNAGVLVFKTAGTGTVRISPLR